MVPPPPLVTPDGGTAKPDGLSMRQDEGLVADGFATAALMSDDGTSRRETEVVGW